MYVCIYIIYIPIYIYIILHRSNQAQVFCSRNKSQELRNISPSVVDYLQQLIDYTHGQRRRIAQ